MKAASSERRPQRWLLLLRRMLEQAAGRGSCSCGGLLAFGAVSVQSNQRLPELPSGLFAITAKQAGNVALACSARIGDIGLRQP